MKQEHGQITGVSETFAERLLAARNKLGLSQAELARRAGLSPGAIGNFEAGTRKQPREIFDLATALEVSPAWLATGKEPTLSRLEAVVLNQLQELGFDSSWVYRPESPTQFSHWLAQQGKFSAEPDFPQYLPDFVIRRPGTDDLVFLEVKPKHIVDSGEASKERFSREMGAVYLRVDDSDHAETLQLLHRVLRVDQSPKPGVAQGLSHSAFHTVPTLVWERMSMSIEEGLPEAFRLQLRDSSMAPRVPAGSWIHFNTAVTARPGDGVLLRDRTGSFHFRYYQAGRPGCWIAQAENSAYAPLDSERDGLEILAVLVAVEARWG